MCNFCHMQLRLQNDYVCTAKKNGTYMDFLLSVT